MPTPTAPASAPLLNARAWPGLLPAPIAARIAAQIAMLAAALVLNACTLVAIDDLPPPRDVPRIQFQQPGQDASYAEGDEVAILLLAEDTGPGVARIDLFIDDLPYQSSTPQVSPAVPVFIVEMNWRAAGVGLHALSAVATRTDGTQSDRTTLRINIVPAAAALSSNAQNEVRSETRREM